MHGGNRSVFTNTSGGLVEFAIIAYSGIGNNYDA
jgi:hypothetical protein